MLLNILIVGATGHLGPSVLVAFANDSRFNVSVLARASSTNVLPVGTHVIRIADDYPAAELVAAMQGKDAVISTIATAAQGVQMALIDAAIDAGVKRFVPSEFGSDVLNDKAMALLPQYFRGKRATVEYLRSKEGTGLSWTAFVTGPLFELGLAPPAFMGFDLANHAARITDDGSGTWSTTTLSAVGEAVKQAMLRPAETANRYLYIASFTLNSTKLLAALEKVAGGEPWAITRVNGAQERDEGLARMAKGDFSGAMLIIRYINTATGYGADYLKDHESANELLALPKEDLEECLGKLLRQALGGVNA